MLCENIKRPNGLAISLVIANLDTRWAAVSPSLSLAMDASLRGWVQLGASSIRRVHGPNTIFHSFIPFIVRYVALIRPLCWRHRLPGRPYLPSPVHPNRSLGTCQKPGVASPAPL